MTALLLGLLACSGQAPTAPPERAAPAQAPDAGAAPSRLVFGLELGVSDADAVEAWIAAQGIACPPAKDGPRVCPQVALPGRQTPAELTLELDGPLRQLSALRTHDTPDAAVRDYAATGGLLREQLGPPLRASDPDMDWTAPQIRETTLWRFSDLEVRLTLLRARSAQVRVSEVWSVP